ncbi:GM19437 [Drosophila sechellia]|uniref:GM19437 n=1 Tax=Drosophila sechellia TaxID=7238 RepID=B4IDM7_DROSE|nr:GM19437 [Drosophila sechellia]
MAQSVTLLKVRQLRRVPEHSAPGSGSDPGPGPGPGPHPDYGSARCLRFAESAVVIGVLLMPQGQPHAPCTTLLSFVVLHVPRAAHRQVLAIWPRTPLSAASKKEKTAKGRVLCRATKKKWHKNRVHASKIQRSAYENEPARGKATGHDERNAGKKYGKVHRRGSGLDADDCCSSLFKFYVLAFHTC